MSNFRARGSESDYFALPGNLTDQVDAHVPPKSGARFQPVFRFPPKFQFPNSRSPGTATILVAPSRSAFQNPNSKSQTPDSPLLNTSTTLRASTATAGTTNSPARSGHSAPATPGSSGTFEFRPRRGRTTLIASPEGETTMHPLGAPNSSAPDPCA